MEDNVKTNGGFEINQIRGFVAKLKLADKATKDYYSAVKNRLLSYKGVKDRMTFKQENFRANKSKVAVLKMQGKTLCLYLDVKDPATLEKYERYLKHVEKAKMEDTPYFVRITSDRKLSYALNIADAMFAEKNIPLGKESNEDFTKDIKRESLESMVEKGLIKEPSSPKGIKAPIQEDQDDEKEDEVEEVDALEEEAEEPSEDLKEETTETPEEEKEEVVTEVVEETPTKEEPHEDYDKVSKRTKVVKGFVTAFIYIFLVLVAVLVLFPFFAMLTSSVKTITEFKEPVPTIIPREWHFENYMQAYEAADLGQLFLNTVFVGVVSTLLSLVITVLSAFAFARLEFKGKTIMFSALLATMMIPGELFTITNYETVAVWLNWKSTFVALIVPFLVSVFYIYLLRQNFLQIPNELYLAAKVDGTSDIKYLIKVMVPLSMPTLISITILKMMGAWNSYIWPRLVANDTAHKLVTNGLRGTAFQDDSGQTNFPVQMAAVAVVSLPLFLVFLFLRKYIMKGVSRSGIKG